jgi:hypothetical protein
MLHFATHYVTPRSAVLDGWQLLDWLEVWFSFAAL